MILLLLLVYTGQSLAAIAVPCGMMGAAGDVAAGMDLVAGMAAMNHAGHQMSSDDAQQQAGDNGCCESGFCSMSHCQSVAALPQLPPPAMLVMQAVLHDIALVSSLHNTADTLFRPPISR
jgi:hypothetical protein